MRYEAFTDAWDFAGYSQSVWSASKGHLFQYTTEPFFSITFPDQLGMSFLATHFTLVLVLFVPFVWLFPTPMTLLVLQAAWFGATGYFVYRISRLYFGTGTSLIFLVLFLGNPSVLNSQFSGLFHAETFAFLSETIAMYGLLARKYLYMWIGIALTLLTIEVSPYIVIPILIVYVIKDRPKLKSGILGCAVVLAYLLLADYARNWLGLDTSSASVSFAINSANWSVLGAILPIDIPWAIISHPTNILPALSYASVTKIAWIGTLFAPLLLVSILEPLLLLPALPWFTATLLSNYSGYYGIFANQVAAFVLPFVFVAAIGGFRRVNSRKILALMVIFTFISLGAYGPFAVPINHSTTVTTHDVAEQHVLDLIPGNASVLTTSEISPHLSMRDRIYQDVPEFRPIYATVSVELLQRLEQTHVDYIVLDTFSSLSAYLGPTREQILTLFNFSSYGLYAFSDGVMLFKHDWSSAPVLFSFGETFGPGEFDLLPGTTVTSGMIVVGGAGSGWFGPYIILPPGNYTAVFNLKVESGSIDIDVASDIGTKILASSAADHTGTYRLDFSLDRVTNNVEFRGLNASMWTIIELQNLTVTAQ